MRYELMIGWAARLLSIAFAFFISLFALDAFSENQGFWSTLLSLLIHLIPSLIIVLILILAWRWEWLGGILYTLLGIVYIFYTNGKMDWTAYVIISGPLILLGILFFIAWRQKMIRN